MTNHHNTLVFGRCQENVKLIWHYSCTVHICLQIPSFKYSRESLIALPDSRVSKSLFVGPVHLGAFPTLAALSVTWHYEVSQPLLNSGEKSFACDSKLFMTSIFSNFSHLHAYFLRSFSKTFSSKQTTHIDMSSLAPSKLLAQTHYLFSGESESESHTFMSDSLRPHGIVHGILQARILEWVAFPFFRRSPQFRDQTTVFCIADSLPAELPGKLYSVTYLHTGVPRF